MPRGDVLKRLRNLTLHGQGERERVIAADAGFALEASAEGFTVEAGRPGLERALIWRVL